MGSLSHCQKRGDMSDSDSTNLHYNEFNFWQLPLIDPSLLNMTSSPDQNATFTSQKHHFQARMFLPGVFRVENYNRRGVNTRKRTAETRQQLHPSHYYQGKEMGHTLVWVYLSILQLKVILPKIQFPALYIREGLCLWGSPISLNVWLNTFLDVLHRLQEKPYCVAKLPLRTSLE